MAPPNIIFVIAAEELGLSLVILNFLLDRPCQKMHMSGGFENVGFDTLFFMLSCIMCNPDVSLMHIWCNFGKWILIGEFSTSQCLLNLGVMALTLFDWSHKALFNPFSIP